MAKKVVTIYTDDLTGEESSEASTHTIALDGVNYEIDLGPDSYDKLLEALAPFTAAGRRARGTRKASGRAVSAASSGEDTAKIRSWARENGYEVNDRGRVPAEIREAYTKAH
ncbi:Lsr2 family protein [Streptomyces noursei]|uniref:histone-like nucleoid-structuring protein Lsr2 n=1 Tax=Streptomyces noursei TaxID=1971 RepID=UPI00332EF976